MNAPAPIMPAPIVNAIPVELEDYFQVHAFAGCVGRAGWDSFAPRVADNTHRILDQFARHRVKGKFFTLGWVAERHPAPCDDTHSKHRRVGGGAHRPSSGSAQPARAARRRLRREFARCRLALSVGVADQSLLAHRHGEIAPVRERGDDARPLAHYERVECLIRKFLRWECHALAQRQRRILQRDARAAGVASRVP